MPTIELPQGTITYRVAGPESSRPVVFVHGVLVDGELWTGVADALAAHGIRSYAPTWPLGAHPTAMDREADLSPRGVARMILDFLAALDLDDVTLVGNDTGGAICQFLVDIDDSRIGRLVLTNCDAFDVFPPTQFKMLFKVGRNKPMVRALAAPMRLRAVRHSFLGYGVLFAKTPDPTLTRRWIEPALRDAGVRRDVAKLLRGVDKKELLDVSTRLGDFDKPVLLLWGAADPAFKVTLARRLRDAFSNATLVELPGGRTFHPLEDPERVADEIATRLYVDVDRTSSAGLQASSRSTGSIEANATPTSG